MKKIAAKRWRRDRKLSFLPLLSNSTSEPVHSSPRGTSHIFFLAFLAGGITVWNFRDQELCDCFVSECDESQSSSSGVGSGGNSLLSLSPFVRKVFSSFERCWRFPSSWIVIDDAAAMLELHRSLGSNNWASRNNTQSRLVAWHSVKKQEWPWRCAGSWLRW